MANPVIFRRNTNIGAADAESDEIYLEQCFIDTGDINSLLDCDDPKCIVLGRTGAGKTALLKHLISHADNAIELSPEALALSYVNNSQVLKFFEEAGVNLDVFYSLLWRHIITIELLKARYGINDRTKQLDFMDRMKSIFTRNKAKERALAYLEEWGDRFWEETEYRTKEFTRKLETDLKGAVNIDAKYFSLGAEGAKTLSEEELVVVRDNAQRVVSEVQVKELHDVISLLSEDLFNDRQKRYYIVIDRLDEDWVGDHVRFRLIKSLMETIRTFKKVHSVKIVIALRTDLHDRVLKETVSSGFQEEKFKSLYLPLRWNRQQLERLLADRVKFMFRRQYTREDVDLKDILPPNQIDQRTASDYILDRTFFRPREAIIFLNECISRAEGSTKITVQLLRQAEVTYSQQRLVSLADEWRRDYPNLQLSTSILVRRDIPFCIDDIGDSDAEALALNILENGRMGDELFSAAERFYLGGKDTRNQFMETILSVHYAVGLVGIKPAPHLGRQWSYQDSPALMAGQLRSSSQIDVHKTFWASLGVLRRGKGAFSPAKT